MMAAVPVRRRWLTFLLAVNAILGAVLAFELRRADGIAMIPLPQPPAAAPMRPAVETGQIPAQPQTLSPVETYAAIVERPLFIPGRRPIAASARAPAPAPAPGGLPTLKGLIMTGDRAAAVFQLPDSKQYVLGAKGEMVGSWRVEDIAPDRVVLGRNATRRVLELGDLAAPRHGAAAPLAAGGRRRQPGAVGATARPIPTTGARVPGTLRRRRTEAGVYRRCAPAACPRPETGHPAGPVGNGRQGAGTSGGSPGTGSGRRPDRRP